MGKHKILCYIHTVVNIILEQKINHNRTIGAMSYLR
jgi:hypothetical protein